MLNGNPKINLKHEITFVFFYIFLGLFLLNLCVLLDSYIWLDTINLGKSIVHI